MSTWDRLRAIFRREKRELDEIIRDATDRGNDALDRKEHELAATPEERLRIEEERARAADDDFDAIRRRIERGE